MLVGKLFEEKKLTDFIGVLQLLPVLSYIPFIVNAFGFVQDGGANQMLFATFFLALIWLAGWLGVEWLKRGLDYGFEASCLVSFNLSIMVFILFTKDLFFSSTLLIRLAKIQTTNGKINIE
jgi:hypothetical protein